MQNSTLSADHVRTIPIPRNGTKYSPNLARWLNKNQRFGRRADVFLDREGCRWIGWIEDGQWFIGNRLMRTLIDGTKANVGCWTFPVSDLSIDDGFWDRYERIGRCAVDEAHTQLFIGDDSRWRQDGATRECTWCGAFAQRERVWSETVEHRVWEPIAHLNTIAQGGVAS